jgi:Co/Zn/Cd efflux system component
MPAMFLVQHQLLGSLFYTWTSSIFISAMIATGELVVSGLMAVVVRSGALPFDSWHIVQDTVILLIVWQMGALKDQTSVLSRFF